MSGARGIVTTMDSASPTRPQSHEHHTVSKFWLKQFADSSGFLKRFDVGAGELNARRIHSKRATVVTDLYILDSWNATHDVDEHDLLRPLEDKAAKVMGRLRAAEDLSRVWPLDSPARNQLALYLAASVIRTPRYREHVQASAERMLEGSDRPPIGVDLFRSGVLTGDPEDLARLGRRYGLWHKGEQAPANFQSDYLRDQLPRLARHLFEQRWVIMRAPTPYFTISDNPVALIGGAIESGRATHHSVDFRNSRWSVTALSRDLVLMTDWHPPSVLSRLNHNGDMTTEFDQGRANMARALMIANADTDVFAHPADLMIEQIWGEFERSSD